MKQMKPKGARQKGMLLIQIFTFVSMLVPVLSSCRTSNDPEPSGLVQPTGPAPAYAPAIDAQMLAVIEQFIAFGTPPLPSLSPRQARMAPSFREAVETLLRNNNRRLPRANVTISQRILPGSYTPGAAPDGLLVRIYRPLGTSGPLPVVVYYHGGGWVLGSIEGDESTATALAERVGAVVVSVNYRLAPESKFPAAHEDAYAAYKWVRDSAAVIGGNPTKVAVAGESAGGNLAAGVCLLARERGLALPVHQVLAYPVTNNDLTTASQVQYAAALPLDRSALQYFFSNYLNSPADGDNRLISLVDVPDLSGLPPATIIGAEIDPLQTEGQQYADRLRQSNVPVTYQLYQGTTHGFLIANAVIPKAEQAQQLAATQLRLAFQ